jgi:hypothetical protein
MYSISGDVAVGDIMYSISGDVAVGDIMYSISCNVAVGDIMYSISQAIVHVWKDWLQTVLNDRTCVQTSFGRCYRIL